MPPIPIPQAPVAPPVAELPVPLASLSQPDDQEQLKTPAQGDTVSLQVDATVSRIEGETAFITPTAINGKPLEEANETAQPAGLDEQEAGLREAMGNEQAG
jgi:hypothetical protein